MTDVQRLLFSTIGSPFSSEETKPTPEDVDACFDSAFENRVALFFLERCRERGVRFSPSALENHQRLLQRREETTRVMVDLATALQEKAFDRWVLFKSLKPFPSTPNDTDWFPFDISEHPALVEHLLNSGFSLLEKAPMQTTLVEDHGLGITHSDKRGGTYYIDCYRAPAADYFIYLDPAKLKRHLTHRDLDGHQVPALSASGELVSTMFHNVFPEKTFSIEAFFFNIHTLKEIDDLGQTDDFVETVRENCVEKAISANLALTATLHRHYYGDCPPIVTSLSELFPDSTGESAQLESSGFQLPYNFSNRCFWASVFDKLRDSVALKSAFVQGAHMLNPLFFIDVMQIIWKRTRKGGVYKQM